MEVKIICVGKIKERYYRDALKEYEKRLSKYCKLNIIELDDVSLGNVELNKEKEASFIKKHLNDKDYIICLDIKGIELNSVELSDKIDNIMQNNSTIDFIIGGSYGLSNQITKNSDCNISFSKLTFPHQLFRVILLEQIYRTFKIINNESYHK